MIEYKNVSMLYESGVEAVKNANLTIEKGDFVFIVGKSGSGKSTMIKMLMKEVDPTEGAIFIDGFDITTMKKSKVPFLRRSMGFVFQDFRLLPNKTVYENVAYAMRIVESSPSKIRRQVPLALSLVGVSNRANMYPDELSGGEQQRVAVARAIVNNPTLLLADEPTGNLDPITAKEIINLLNDINLRGTTVIIATHASDIVNAMQKRVIAIDKGVICRDEKGGYSYES
ncbi:MAG: cell division ATP-binding protein FtsE [Clostridia bacterium]|nr:cell division ATP-binding protein FtsE [Clostridia bacterium]